MIWHKSSIVSMLLRKRFLSANTNMEGVDSDHQRKKLSFIPEAINRAYLSYHQRKKLSFTPEAIYRAKESSLAKCMMEEKKRRRRRKKKVLTSFKRPK